MQSDEIRSKFLNFFENHGHNIVPSSSLIPNDPSVLFTTAGMQQFKPYYTSPESADKDFGSRNIVTVQKCVRTGDIDEVGDATHLTFFEMLGNFSFGGYGRREAITYAHDFITKELGLEISYVTFYKGEGVVPRDEESKDIWALLGVRDIRTDGGDVFWGPTGENGPCGPTTEIYCKNDAGEDVEIWNIVFNEYFCDGSREKLDKGEASLKKLEVLGIDTGMGLERLLATIQKKKSVYGTDVFHNEETKEERIVSDHVRTATFMIADDVIPSNTDRGYILRRLIRRAIRYADKLGLKQGQSTTRSDISTLADGFIKKYMHQYPNLALRADLVFSEIEMEEQRFRKTLDNGLRAFEKGEDPFVLFTTYGFPIELTIELAKEKGKTIDLEDFNKKMSDHQKLSQTSSAGMFKGGLANHNEKTVKLHTAHHLLLAALQSVVDKNIRQRGSNITEERLRMDFLCDHKLTDEEKKKVEDFVNDKIEQGLNVIRKEIPLAEAQKIGAEMEFGAKYPDIVSVYFIEDKNGDPISKEFCGGPHVTNTKQLGGFKIQKEEAVAQGIRRIKGVLV